jgi:hypothetical protein
VIDWDAFMLQFQVSLYSLRVHGFCSPSIQLLGKCDMVVLEIVWQLGFGVQLPILFSSGL